MSFGMARFKGINMVARIQTKHIFSGVIPVHKVEELLRKRRVEIWKLL
jgi:hypothetical protein